MGEAARPDTDGKPWDAAVIGGGPAGLSAALWLGRYRRRTVLFDLGVSRNRGVRESHGYFGFDRADPKELRERARADLKRYEDVEIREALVTSARICGDGLFELVTDEEKFTARRVVLAPGLRDIYPEIGNFFDYFGRSVFNCPSCDGYEAQGKRVVVFGWTSELVAFARHLLAWAESVTIITDGAPFEGDEPPDEAIKIVEEDAVELLGPDGKLDAVRLASGGTVEADMGFFAIDQIPENALAEQLGCCLAEAGCIGVDEHGETNVEGVYACGDIVQGPQLIQVAAATGAIAGISCARSLLAP